MAQTPDQVIAEARADFEGAKQDPTTARAAGDVQGQLEACKREMAAVVKQSNAVRSKIANRRKK